MITGDYVRHLARYNRWMNERIYQACSRLDDVQRKADRGAFFKSIHGTLDHILWGDYIWMGRFRGATGAAPTYADPVMTGEYLIEDWHSLMMARSDLDADVCDWAVHVRDEWLAGSLTWYSRMRQAEFTRPAWQVVTHMFNHQTHHRGQVSTLMKQQGIDPGVTDLAAMPE